MGREIEIEAKNLLTKAELTRLQHFFSIEKEQFVSQTNHYFDTEEFALRQKQAALRIREKEKQFELTLKQPNEVGLLETNQIISKEDAFHMIKTRTLPKGEVKDDLQSLGVATAQFSYLGSLTTSRAEMNYRDQLVVLDISHYLDTEDYELEVEGYRVESVQEVFQDILTQHHIPTRPTKNKILRFFERKQQQQGEK